jgi:hypothetical protein
MAMSNLTPLPPLRLPEAPASPGPGAALRAAPAPPGAAEAGPALSIPNPSLRLDASLGLVVLEFRNADGTSRTIPSERELKAYRNAVPPLPGAQQGGPPDPAKR